MLQLYEAGRPRDYLAINLHDVAYSCFRWVWLGKSGGNSLHLNPPDIKTARASVPSPAQRSTGEVEWVIWVKTSRNCGDDFKLLEYTADKKASLAYTWQG